ncbi:unnamed protein product [Lactuca saligna]|uniref:FACT complex subunit SSRP1/POB3 N-terminal PH domain-containing protein n=1 Tax=Lactuca saligna TaxID=75948 RepID=A0AA35YKH7_LACSI|nr:unnamed protein product [Lactuca saligna]
MANLWQTVMAIHRPMPKTMAMVGIQAFDLIHFIREREGRFDEFNQTVNCSLLEIRLGRTLQKLDSLLLGRMLNTIGEDVEHNPKAVEVDKSDISGLTWMKVPWTNQLAVRIKDGLKYKFTGFRDQMSVQKMMNIGLNMDENTTGEDVEHKPKVSLHVDDAAVLCEYKIYQTWMDISKEYTHFPYITNWKLNSAKVNTWPQDLHRNADDQRKCFSDSRHVSVEDKTSNDDVGVTVVKPNETMPEYEGFTIDEKELENAEGGGGIDFDKLELPSSPSVSTCASIRRNASLQICFFTFYHMFDMFQALINVLHKDYTNPMLPVASSTIDATGNIDTVTNFIDLESLSGVIKEDWRQVRHTFKKISTYLVYSEAHISLWHCRVRARWDSPYQGVVHMVAVRMGPTKNCLGDIVVVGSCSKEKEVHEFEKTTSDVGIDVVSHDPTHCCLVLYHIHVPSCGSCHGPCHYQTKVEEKVWFPD